ncbi:MAG: hypothetical protein ISP86_01295 [Shewanellaceae bacterium]|nr:hypothetical protein [Shewanellaceae bacterium]
MQGCRVSLFKQAVLSFMALLLLHHSAIGSAGLLAHHLSYQAEDDMRWTQHRKNLIEIEHNLYRNMIMSDHEMENIAALIHPDHIDGLNFFLHNSHNPAMLEMNRLDIEQTEQTSQYLENILQSLPPLEVSSYAGQWISMAQWEHWNIGHVYHEMGFYHSYATLPEAYENLAMHNPIQKVGLIVHIEGKQSRLMNSFTTEDHSQLVWPRHTNFKIMEKDFSNAHQKYYLRLQEMSSNELEQASSSLPSLMMPQYCEAGIQALNE